MKIWDTVGAERITLRSLTANYFKNADGVIVAFDLTNYDSFLNVRDWIRCVHKHKELSFPIVLIGNKYDLCDLEQSATSYLNRQVEHDAASELSACYNISYFETSAKSDKNITETMQHIFEKSHEYKMQFQLNRRSFGLIRDRHTA